jgi:molybdopterin adenylyltransferase
VPWPPRAAAAGTADFADFAKTAEIAAVADSAVVADPADTADPAVNPEAKRLTPSTATARRAARAVRAHPDELIVGLVSVSDRASAGVYADQGLPGLRDWLGCALASPWQAHQRLIADERAQIEAALVELVDEVGCDLVLTTGGTGPARRDVTPEATLAVATREMPGFGEQMRRISLAFVPTAILSRQVGVLREVTDADGRGHAALILNLPGQPKAIAETLEGLQPAAGQPAVPGIFAAVPYCIQLIGGPYVETHADVVMAFRPRAARRTAGGA